MKIILSRKGFDSASGGCPSPILPNGNMISLPIPSSVGLNLYSDLRLEDGKTYSSLLEEIYPANNLSETCHLDPDIRETVTSRPANWCPAFGQIDAAETILENNDVGVGDLFLFFGWYRKCEYTENGLRFAKNAPDIQAIYGYLQIGEILKGENVRRCSWHPHSDDAHIFKKNGELSNNTIYIASDSLKIGSDDMGIPGAGTFLFSDDVVLTADGMSRSRWKLNEVFGKVPLSHHGSSSVKDGFFQSVCRGQEFVFDEDPRVTEWAKKIILGQKK